MHPSWPATRLSLFGKRKVDCIDNHFKYRFQIATTCKLPNLITIYLSFTSKNRVLCAYTWNASLQSLPSPQGLYLQANSHHWTADNLKELHQKLQTTTGWYVVLNVGTVESYFFDGDGAGVTVNSKRYVTKLKCFAAISWSFRE